MIDAADGIHVAQDPQRREVRITTPRLELRDIVEEDAGALLPLWNEPASFPRILRHQRDAARNARRLEGYARYNAWAAWQDREAFALAVRRRGDGIVLGSCGLSYLDRHGVILGWHYGIAHAGQGYATEVGHALLRFAFEELEVRRAVADCHADNAAVHAVLRKLGMRREGGRVREWWRGLRYGALRRSARFCVHRDALPATAPSP